MTDQRYLTVGELARRVGVTVRTIQYYDQQGLLSPSAKGPQNQRLYTDCLLYTSLETSSNTPDSIRVRIPNLRTAISSKRSFRFPVLRGGLAMLPATKAAPNRL